MEDSVAPIVDLAAIAINLYLPRVSDGMSLRILLMDRGSVVGSGELGQLHELLHQLAYPVVSISSEAQLAEAIREGFDGAQVILCHRNEIFSDVLEEYLALNPALRVIVFNEDVDIDAMRQSMKAGAFDYVRLADLTKNPAPYLEAALVSARKLQKVTAAQDVLEENKRLSEIDTLKTEFFTNISHELRTPLTVIRGMADQIEEQPEKWTGRGVELIRRNTDDLLDLVNQILDLHKLESGSMKSMNMQRDVLPFLSYIAQVFEPMAERAGLTFQFESKMESLVMDFDLEKLQRILFNLLSNAIKFTEPGGAVSIIAAEVEGDLELQIRDTGIGIRKEILDRIFDRFFQSKENFHNVKIGTGIGLALVRELVNLMEGTISVESNQGIGSTFILKLPIRRKAVLESSAQSGISYEYVKQPTIEPGLKSLEKTTGLLSELPQLLIVEDSPDIVEYLRACLEEYYEISVGANGEEGLKLAFDNVPDLVISDVMMPKMTGLELCATLKKDTRTSHVPIVLLTAKADESSRIEGLGEGADAYMTKPFNRQELLVRLGKLHHLRQTLRERYQSLDHILEQRSSGHMEDSFMAKLYREVLENGSDPDFGVAELCRQMTLSRTQLHRKIKALTDRSTTSFIRWIRLSQAQKLIENTDQRISEIAYSVGFSDPRYFSRSYLKEFGHNPTQEKRFQS